jgi:hypothetical protein
MLPPNTQIDFNFTLEQASTGAAYARLLRLQDQLTLALTTPALRGHRRTLYEQDKAAVTHVLAMLELELPPGYLALLKELREPLPQP